MAIDLQHAGRSIGKLAIVSALLFNCTCTDGRRFVVLFVGAALRRNNMVNCRVFFRRTTFDVPI